MSLSYNGDGGGARVLGKLEEDHSFWMCCFTWPTCNSSWVKMEGSSGSAFHNSGSSRALNSSGVSDRNQRVHCPQRNPFSGEASQDSGFRKERDRVLLAQGGQPKNLGGGFSGLCE